MHISRRGFLTTIAAGTAAGSGVGVASATGTWDRYDGVVLIRDHFDTTWDGDVSLAEGNTRTDYESPEHDYRLATWDTAVGQWGCEGTEPANLSDHRVDDVADHGSYPEPDGGCFDEVVGNSGEPPVRQP
jgi:hypothetical protein